MSKASNIVSILHFRKTMIIETDLDVPKSYLMIKKMIEQNPSCINAAFKKNHFAFAYQKVFPNLYNYGSFVFDGEISKNHLKTYIRIDFTAPKYLFYLNCFLFVFLFISLILVSFISHLSNEYFLLYMVQFYIIILLFASYISYVSKYSNVKTLFTKAFKMRKEP